MHIISLTQDQTVAEHGDISLEQAAPAGCSIGVPAHDSAVVSTSYSCASWSVFVWTCTCTQSCGCWQGTVLYKALHPSLHILNMTPHTHRFEARRRTDMCAGFTQTHSSCFIAAKCAGSTQCPDTRLGHTGIRILEHARIRDTRSLSQDSKRSTHARTPPALTVQEGITARLRAGVRSSSKTSLYQRSPLAQLFDWAQSAFSPASREKDKYSSAQIPRSLLQPCSYPFLLSIHFVVYPCERMSILSRLSDAKPLTCTSAFALFARLSVCLQSQGDNRAVCRQRKARPSHQSPGTDICRG